MAKSSAKVYSYVSLFANTRWMRLRFKCFACNETHLEWFRRETDKIALGFGGSCDENIHDSQGGHPKQFVNYLAVEPGVLAWQASLLLPLTLSPFLTHPHPISLPYPCAYPCSYL